MEIFLLISLEVLHWSSHVQIKLIMKSYFKYFNILNLIVIVFWTLPPNFLLICHLKLKTSNHWQHLSMKKSLCRNLQKVLYSISSLKLDYRKTISALCMLIMHLWENRRDKLENDEMEMLIILILSLYIVHIQWNITLCPHKHIQLLNVN